MPKPSKTLNILQRVRKLEKKGLIESHMGGATAARGGRRKRIFEATAQGREVIAEIKASRQKLWDLIPSLS